MNMQHKITAALMGAIVGDALGVPVESTPRSELSLCSVKNMLGYGRFDHPQGTWSDDSSMIFCTIESLLDGYDLEEIGQTYCKWLFDGYWTAEGYVFDAGLTTFLALDRIRNAHTPAKKAGGTSDEDNGNGSLMRILPAALCFFQEPIETFLSKIHEISAITHAHPRACLGCGIYSLLIRELQHNTNKLEALRRAGSIAMDYYSKIPEFKPELSHFMRILSLDVPNLVEAEISSSGYIVDTLEASIWCFLQHESTREVLLTAVNLGLDTDTTGAVAGGLAGFVHGIDSIPAEWLDSLTRKDAIDDLISRFASKVAQPS